ncbi:MAG: tyrosine-type recombinase/integrase [Candidatus Latescibacteria bacterium]|nr:tyrosine-type recombinase/integrase [Candidatus Latescibacterota bacterium]
MAGVRAKPNRRGRYQGWFMDASGKQRFFLGTRSKPDTLRMAERLEDERRQIRLGYRPAPLSADKHSKRPFAEVIEEYLAWGESQGGKGGGGWASVHARMRRTHLKGWWQERLGLATLADLDGMLPRVEKALRELQAQGKAGKTLANHAESLHALCLWAEQRGYLAADPLKGLAPFDTAPQTRRRALSAEEITRFLSTCNPSLRPLYETAFLSGLRAGELRRLTLDHLDRERCGLRLDAEWTKNRQPGFQPLPKSLVERLYAFAEAGEPDRLYAQAYAQHRKPGLAPKGRLLYVPTHTHEAIAEDLKRAGISKWTPQGKVDFHALRVAFINLVIDSGATVKEAQTLARHSTADLTMNVYGRTRPERLAETVERVAEKLFSIPEHVPSMYKQAVGAETASATPFDTRELRLKNLVAVEGIEPPTRGL